MAKLKAPFALDRSLNTTEQTSRNIADVLAEELSAIITALGGLNFINYEVVEELPTTEISTTTIYLVPSDDPQSGNTYDEYINLNGTSAGWEKIGSTAIDLSGYYTSAETDALLDEKVDKDSFDEQTATDEFTTINGGLLSECKITLEPIQDLHGYDSPWVGGASDNLLPMTVDGIKALNTDGTWNGNVYTWRGITYTILTDDGNNVIGIDTNGTASERGWLFLAEKHFDDGDVTFGGTAYASRDNYSYYCGFTNQDAYIYYNSSSNKSYILIANGYTTNNQKWYPIVRTKTTEAPVFSPYSNICPITGHTESKVQNIGKNLLYIKNKAYANRTGNLIDATGAVCTDLIPCVPNETFTAYKSSILSAESYSMVARRFDENGNYIGNIAVMSYDEIGYKTITIPSDAYFIGVVQYGVLDSNDNYLADIMFARGVHDTYVPYNGYQITVNLGGTYYSGTLDVVTGVASVTWIKFQMTASNGEFSATNNRYIVRPTNIGLPEAVATFDDYNCISDKFVSISARQGSLGGEYGIYANANIVAICGFKTSLSDYQTWLTNNPVDVCYKLATPQSIQLTPQQVKALVEENYLSAPLEGQEIDEVKYKKMFTFDDVIAYIQSLS